MFRARASATPLDEDVDDSSEGTAAALVRNTHWLGAEGVSQQRQPGEASNFVGYYHAASLYPSSSKYKRTPDPEGIS